MDRRQLSITGTGGTGYIGPLEGVIEAFYLDTGDQAATLDVTITDHATGAAILVITNASADGWYPVRYPTVGPDGAALVYAPAGSPVEDKVPISGDLKVVWAQGGAAAVGTLYVFVNSL